MNLSQVVIDYVYVCERRSEQLDFGEFIELWTAADALLKTAVDLGVELGDVDATLKLATELAKATDPSLR
jgi:hypothetical protein